MNNISIAFLAFLGFIAVAAVAIVVTRRGSPVTESSQLAYALPVEPHIDSAPVLYENEERTQIIRGPDRLIEEIIVHRKVTQNA